MIIIPMDGMSIFIEIDAMPRAGDYFYMDDATKEYFIEKLEKLPASDRDKVTFAGGEISLDDHIKVRWAGYAMTDKSWTIMVTN